MIIDKLEKFFTLIIAGIVLIFIFLILNKLLENKIVADKDIIIYILGSLTSILTTIVGYYFGSSHSSSKKNEMIDKLKK